RLGAGRRDSAAQITTVSPPTETRETSPPPPRRRRSSLAQLTDILREWGGASGKGGRGSKDAQLVRRETLADLARSLPWGRGAQAEPTAARKRRESSADSGVKSGGSSRSAISDLARLWSSRRESTVVVSPRRGSGESARSGGRRDSGPSVHPTSGSRRGSGESGRHHHHHSHSHSHGHHKRRQEDLPPPPSLPPPTIVTSASITPPPRKPPPPPPPLPPPPSPLPSPLPPLPTLYLPLGETPPLK
ncbi:hypothetical protein AAG570_008417, partial [Ranatra chinensis]